MVLALRALALAALLLVAATSTVSAQGAPQLPVGESKGVKIVRDDRGAQVWVFTREADRLHRRVRGKRVFVSCTDLPDERKLGGDEYGGGQQYERVPKRGRVLPTGDLSNWDYCRLFLPAHTVKRKHERERISRRLLVSIPLTQDGAVHLDGQLKSALLDITLQVAGGIADERHQTTWPLIGDLPERARAGLRLVPLAAPQDSPPPKMIGYYSDGQQHVAVSMLSATGVRLFIELEAGDVIRTNALGYSGNWD